MNLNLTSHLNTFSFTVECSSPIYLNDTSSASRLTDAKIVEIAKVIILGGITIAGLAAFALKRFVIKNTPQMIQVFESRWKERNPGEDCIPINDLLNEEDCAHLRKIFGSWRLCLSITLFDLLCVQIYRNWKRAGLLSLIDLEKFAWIYKCLEYLGLSSMKSMEDVKKTHHELKRFIDELRKQPNIVSEVNRLELEILLKMLADPQKGQLLGTSSVLCFEGGEYLVKGQSSREDLNDFLEFAGKMYPSLSPLSTHKGKTTIYAEMLKLKAKMQKGLTKAKGASKAARMRKYNAIFPSALLMKIDNLINMRLLNVKIWLNPVPYRLFTNCDDLNKYKFEDLPQDNEDWIRQKYIEILGKDFFSNLDLCLAKYRNTLSFSRLFSNECQIGTSLSHLELAIREKLAKASKEIQSDSDKHKYAQLVVHLFRLYRVVHDVKFMQDRVKNDRLQDRLFPSSLADLAILDSAENNNFSDENIQPFRAASESVATNLSFNASVEKKDSSPRKEEDSRPSKIKTRKAVQSSELDTAPTPSVPVNHEPDSELEIAPFSFGHNTPFRVVLKRLYAEKFEIVRYNGGHYQLRHPITKITTTVPYHGKTPELRIGTLSSIECAVNESRKKLALNGITST